MAERRQPEQQAPPVQRIRMQYAKRGRARFTSHRDFARAFERALRRAGVPMAFSSGFNPHPRISYANAVPTGVATEAEYLEIGVKERCDVAALRTALGAALPPGLEIVELVEAASDTLADHLQVSDWQIELFEQGGLTAAIPAFLSEDSIVVSRITKNGPRDFDARAATVSLCATDDSVVRAVVQHEVPQVRPDDVVRGLAQLHGVEVDLAPVRITRMGQGTWVDGVLTDPLASSRR